MKRPVIKLKLSRETIRTLDHVDLRRAIGGEPIALGDTNAAMCTTLVVQKSPGG
jgi:hypothetical protein